MGLFYPFILSPAVLEPNFYLRLGELEHLCQFAPSATADVLIPLELDLESQRLVAGKRRPLSPRSGILSPSSGH